MKSSRPPGCVVEMCKQQLIKAARSRNAHVNCTDGKHVPTCDTNDIDRAAVVRAFGSGPPSHDAVSCTDQQLMDFATNGVIPGSSLPTPPPTPSFPPIPTADFGAKCHLKNITVTGTKFFNVLRRQGGQLQCAGVGLPDQCSEFDAYSCSGDQGAGLVDALVHNTYNHDRPTQWYNRPG